MHYDKVLKKVGEFGRYQRKKYLLICLFAFTIAFQTFASLFTIATPKHRCALPPGIYNGTDSWISQSAEQVDLIKRYIPLNSDGAYDSCHIYDFSDNKTSNSSRVKCDTWVYDLSERTDSMVTKLNLVCDQSMKATLATTMYMIGGLAGSAGCGVISDYFGRRITLLLGILGQLVTGLLIAFTTNFYLFITLRFVLGMFMCLAFLVAFVLGMELVGPSYRVVTGFMIEVFYATGFITLIAIAYVIRTEMYLQLALTAPCILFISYYWLLPESPRWLIAKGRYSEAKKIIDDITRENGCLLLNDSEDMKLDTDKPEIRESPKALFHYPRLLIRTLIVFFSWFVISLSYYGLSFNSGNMSGSLYINVLFSATGELVGYLLCFICFVLGRKTPHVVGMIVGGVACLSCLLVHYAFHGNSTVENWLFVSLNTVGKIGVTMGFAIIYLWSAEIFPTALRNSLMGSSSMCSRIGSILAPVIADIGKVVPPPLSEVLPSIIFGVLTISGGLLSIILPETNKKRLPETIAAANVFPRILDQACSVNRSNEEEEPLIKRNEGHI